jgi:hypothetical protein
VSSDDPSITDQVDAIFAERPARHPAAQGVCGCPLFLDTKQVEHRKGCPFPLASIEAATWNRWFEDRLLSPLGAPVRYWMGDREGEGRIGTARTGAQVLGGHIAVLWVNETAGAVALTHVQNLTRRYADAHGEHWHPAGHDEEGLRWLRCEETNRGVRYRGSVEQEFGPLTDAGEV